MVGRPKRKVARYLGTTATLNDEATLKAGRPVLMVEVLPAAAGDVLELRFVSAASPRPQGVWMAVDGEFEVADQRSAQFTFWKETAPPAIQVRVLAASPPVIWMYNVWQEPQRGETRSQSHESGMLKDDDGSAMTYRCRDLGPDARYDAVVFQVRRQRL